MCIFLKLEYVFFPLSSAAAAAKHTMAEKIQRYDIFNLQKEIPKGMR